MLCGGLWCLDMRVTTPLWARRPCAPEGGIARTILLGGSDVVVHAAPTLKRLLSPCRVTSATFSVTAIERFLARLEEKS